MELYSVEYLEILRDKHKTYRWGGSVLTKTSEIVYIMQLINNQDVLDYGSGYGCLSENIKKGYEKFNINVIEYDPGIVEKSTIPEPCDLVVCVDVLEHIEPEYVDNVLDDLVRVISNIGYFVINFQEAFQILSNGKNAHLTIHDYKWWYDKLKNRFEIVESINNRTYSKLDVNKVVKDHNGKFIVRKKYEKKRS